ncbi:hypothetical protein HPB50_014588 [Hyalomma asiaticum]|uniref:Uncharacterized protein n=1 Tax=Hyalomma asiaticum TaxID=266040 RepID=A0ACB7S324_HYAAI|nr:hypothetical protein HPB50_014588 [Hyalomma asiaticum]
MIIIAFGTLAFVNPDAVFSPAVMFSCVYMLTIMDTMSTGAPHTLRLKSSGSIATVSQAPQVNMSVRDNITFGRKFEEPYYNKVLEACQLLRDISRMPAGDLTEAGDKRFFAIVRAYFKYSGACAHNCAVVLGSKRRIRRLSLLCTKALSVSMMSDTENATHARRSYPQACRRYTAGVRQSTPFHGATREHAGLRCRQCALFLRRNAEGRIFNRFSVDLEMNDTRVFVFSKQKPPTKGKGSHGHTNMKSPQILVQPYDDLWPSKGVVSFENFSASYRPGIAEDTLKGAGKSSLVLALLRMIQRTAGMITIDGMDIEAVPLNRLRTAVSVIPQHLTETLESVGLIRCYGVMEQFCARFRRMVTVYLESFNMFVYCFAIGRLVSTICALVIIVLTVAIIVAPAHDDPGSAAMAGLSLLSALTVPFATVMVFLGGFWDALGEAAFQRALEYTELPLEKETPTKGKGSHGHTKYEKPQILVQPYDDLWPSKGVVSFENFSASYRPGIAEDTLKGVSFVAEAGQKLAVVGRTGAGKSSLVLALLRMIQRTAGMITIDGMDIEAVPLNRLRTAVSVIPQDYSMFTGTLRENLDPQSCHSDEVLWKVLRSVHLSDFVEKAPEGLSLQVSQKGENLSAGQRQLVALARALLRATKILVLDEATSQMDPDTERKVQASLRESFAHCTVITIAHRIDTILDYDSPGERPEPIELSVHQRCSRRLRGDYVTLPPRSSTCVAVTRRAFSYFEGIADSNTKLILEKGICMTRGLVQLRDGCANVVLTNFGNEVQHLVKGTVIASLNDFVHVSELSIPEAPTPDLQDVDWVLASINIETGLLPSEKEEMHILLDHYPYLATHKISA